MYELAQAMKVLPYWEQGLAIRRFIPVHFARLSCALPKLLLWPRAFRRSYTAARSGWSPGWSTNSSNWVTRSLCLRAAIRRRAAIFTRSGHARCALGGSVPIPMRGLRSAAGSDFEAGDGVRRDPRSHRLAASSAARVDWACRFSRPCTVGSTFRDCLTSIREFPDAGFVSISDNQRVPLPDANWSGTIQHGLPKNLFRPSYEQGSYLAFLGRLTAEKGPEDAIRIARAAGKPLRIAAKIPRAETAYFKKHLEPHIDGEEVRLIGEVDEAKKQPFLAQAAALLFPIDWPEPFGLVMIEAMACGTPVIAYRSGSVPEVIDDGVTGFIVDSEEEAIRAVKELRDWIEDGCAPALRNVSPRSRMAREYEGQYQKLISAATVGRNGARVDLKTSGIERTENVA